MWLATFDPQTLPTRPAVLLSLTYALDWIHAQRNGILEKDDIK